MEVLKNSEFPNNNYRCSLCKLRFRSFGKMQEHMLKDHLLKAKNVQISLPWFWCNQSPLYSIWISTWL